jgi:predicted nucleotidyltransferase
MDARARFDLDLRALAAFCREHGIRSLALFGSALREDFGPASDVDVLIEFEPGRTTSFFGLFDLEEALSSFFGGRKVDLRTADDLSPYFRAEVLKTSRSLYGAA